MPQATTAPRRSAKSARPDTRTAVFQAAAAAFSARGFDGVGVDDIASRAKVNKAMIYYHFTDKLALYRAVVGDMLSTVGRTVTEIADSPIAPAEKLNRFIQGFVRLADSRPWFPTLMLREIAEGAPHLDLDTLGHMKAVFVGFARILAEGEAAGVFRKVNPVLAYTSVVGPLIMNAARERVAARPGRGHLPMLVEISHDDLIAHAQYVAQRMLDADGMARSTQGRRLVRRSAQREGGSAQREGG